MSPHPDILILGTSEASMLLCKPEGCAIDAVISIHGQREFSVEAPHARHRLVLQFDDWELPEADDPLREARIGLRRREAAEYGLSLIPPAREHALAIIDFAGAIRDYARTLLCQCHGGVSRSTAAALICLAVWRGKGAERECLREILAIRACAQPQRDLVRFADPCLNREGALIDALDQH